MCTFFSIDVRVMGILTGLMFGYATDETEEKMPLTITLAHKLNKRMADARRSGELAWIRPDSKSQVDISLPFVGIIYV